MVEEAALAAFPFCSLGSRGSTQARARFSSWIHMKRLCADCSLPSCSASCHGSGSRAHPHTQREQKSQVNMQQAEPATQWGGNKERGCIYCLPSGIHFSCFKLVSSFHEPLDLQIPLIGRQTPKPHGWILMPLQIKPAKHFGHRARVVCLHRGFKLLGAGTRGSYLFSNSWGQQWCSLSQYKQTERLCGSVAELTRALPSQDCAVLWPVAGASSTDLGCQLRPAPPKSHTQKPGRTSSKEGRQLPCLYHWDIQLWRDALWQLLWNPIRFSKPAVSDGLSSPLFLQARARCRVRGRRWRCWGLSRHSFPQLGLWGQMYEQAVHKQTSEKAPRAGASAEREAGDPAEPALGFWATLSRGTRPFCRLR